MGKWKLGESREASEEQRTL